MADTMPTQYAPAERACIEDVLRVTNAIREIPLFSSLFDAIPDLSLILNEYRQTVYVNASLVNYLGLPDPSVLYGQRPGEILDCIRASETVGGCGTTEFCRTCGAINAILSAQKGLNSVEECRVVQRSTSAALDFRVWTTPFRVDGAALTLFVLQDISHEKRRYVLERAFFHDILNTAGALKTAIDTLVSAGCTGPGADLVPIIRDASGQLVEEINAQRALTAAENESLTLSLETVGTRAVLDSIAAQYRVHEVGRGRHLIVDPDAADTTVLIDLTLLKRVVGNMVKNALEATPEGGTVTFGCQAEKEAVEFWVHNPTVMPPDVQLQVFQRSFSTKGAGRGLGTYSMKLLTEKYLKGTVSFTSTADRGTVFRARFPRDLLPAQ